MTVTDVIAPFFNRIMSALPSLLFGLLILAVGYIVAQVGAVVVRRTVGGTGLDRRVADLLGLPAPHGPDAVRSAVGRIVFWLVILFVLIGFFNQIGLPLVAEPLTAMMGKVVSAAPSLLEAGLILVVAWMVAALLRFLVVQVLTRLALERRLSRFTTLEEADLGALPQQLGTLVFYLVLLFALPPFLAALGQSAAAQPLIDMLRVPLTYLPNVVGAALTVGIGWLVARILREVVRNLLVGLGLDRAIQRAGAAQMLGEVRASGVVATITYFVVWVPFIVAGLDALKIEAVSGPAITALNTILAWVPKGLGAAVIVVLAWAIARFLGNLVAELFRGAGFDSLPARLGLGEPLQSVGGRTWSASAGIVVTALILLFAVIEAFEVMGLTQLATFGDRLLAFGVNVIIAGAIVGVGLWAGGFVQQLLRGALEQAGSGQARAIGLAGRYTVGAFAVAMALQQIGFGETIVVTAFALLFGAVCLALALAFGLGSRDVAARAVERVVEGDGGAAARAR